MAEIKYPDYAGERGIGYWLRWKNIAAARQKFLRVDYSNEWRYEFGDPDPPDRSVALSRLLGPDKKSDDGFTIIILGDTGEGDRSQYGLIPLIRAFNPDFLIINGDVAYPAGRIGADPSEDDFIAGFFRPYSNFNCPIWATPGNHEYYSPNHGRDFYDIFCSPKYDRLWSDYGLRHTVRQPGMYWELSDLEGPSKLVIIGIDSGKSANLDGYNSLWQFWKRKIYPDHAQHKWLDERLWKAQDKNGKVIILFHIPALTREKQVEAHLSILHQIIADYNCVKLVVCGHDHNHQQYRPEIFHQYLEREEAHRKLNTVSPHYIVNGGGGAYLQSTDYKDGPYQGFRYPSKEAWGEYAEFGRRIVASVGRDKSWISRFIGMIDKESLSDADVARYLSFILVEYKPKWPDRREAKIQMTPVFLDDLQKLIDERPSARIVRVTDQNLPLKERSVEQCRKRNLQVSF